MSFLAKSEHTSKQRPASSGRRARAARANGGKPPFSSVFAEYYPRVRAFVFSRTGNNDVAEDLAQEVMVAAFRNYDSYDSSKSSLSTWIFVIARNRLKNYYRSHAADRNDSLEAKEGFDLPSSDLLAEEALEFEELATVLQDVLGKLEERERNIIEGAFFHEKSNVGLAEELQMSVSNVGVVKKRTLEKLQRALSLRGYSI